MPCLDMDPIISPLLEIKMNSSQRYLVSRLLYVVMRRVRVCVCDHDHESHQNVTCHRLIVGF